MSYSVILGIVMGIAFIGMIVSAKKQNSNTIAKPFVFVFTAILITCGILMIMDRIGPIDTEKYVNDKSIFTKSSGYKLGRVLAKSMPGKQVIVLTDPTPANNKLQQALIDGLKEGFSTDITNVLIFPIKLLTPISKKNKGKTTQELMTVKDYNKALKKYPRFNILISLIGLPKNGADLDILKRFSKKSSNKPKIILLNCRVNNMYQLMQGGFISTVIYPNPNTKYSEESPSTNLMETFDMRYLFITPENMDKIVKEFPGKVFRKSMNK